MQSAPTAASNHRGTAKRVPPNKASKVMSVRQTVQSASTRLGRCSFRPDECAVTRKNQDKPTVLPRATTLQPMPSYDRLPERFHARSRTSPATSADLAFGRTQWVRNAAGNVTRRNRASASDNARFWHWRLARCSCPALRFARRVPQNARTPFTSLFSDWCRDKPKCRYGVTFSTRDA